MDPMPLPRIQNQLEAMLTKLERVTFNSDDEDFLFCLKWPLSDRIISRIYTGKKSITFTKFNGFQDPKMRVIKFQEEPIEFLHDQDMLAKLFSSSLKDDALKWYFSLPEKAFKNMKILFYNSSLISNIIFMQN